MTAAWRPSGVTGHSCAGATLTFSRGLQRETKRAAVPAGKIVQHQRRTLNHFGRRRQPAGPHKNSLYYYVATKEDLIYKCYEANIRQAHAQLDRAEQAEGSAVDCLMTFLESQIATTLRSLDGEGDYFAAPLEVAALKPEHRDALEEEYRRLLRRLIVLLNEGIDAGHIRACNPVVTIRAIVGALDWSFYWLYEMPREEAGKVIGVLRDLFTYGLFSSTEPALAVTLRQAKRWHQTTKRSTEKPRTVSSKKPFSRRAPGASTRRVLAALLWMKSPSNCRSPRGRFTTTSPTKRPC